MSERDPRFNRGPARIATLTKQCDSRDILTYHNICHMSRRMTERTTVRLPGDLLKRAKRKAAAEGRTLTALIEDGLRLVLTDRANTAPKKRIVPPVSSASGGLMPGIDLNDTAALQELDDLDAMRTL